MNERRLPYNLSLGLIFLLFGCFIMPETAENAESKPNILLILSDDHSVPYLGVYGNKDLQTPNLDKLAMEGVLFQRAYTTAPQCVPSRSSILTGRNVIDIRMSRFSAPLPRDVPTIPEFLRPEGYYTGICGRSYHLDGSGKRPPETDEAFEKYKLTTFKERVDYLNSGSDDKVLGQFKEFLDQVPGKKPFFMWMNYSDPHRPFTADSFEPDPKSLRVPEGMPDTEEVRKGLAQHLGEIMRLDSHVGEVLQELEKRGVAKNTVVIFMGDNGAALLRGKGTLYDLGIHVPLIVAGPGVKSGLSTDALVSGIDIAPTVLALAGVDAPTAMTGQSFLPALRGLNHAGSEYIFASRVPHGSSLPMNTGAFDLARTVFDKKYKLIYNTLWQLPYSPVDFNNHPLWQDLIARKKNGKLDAKYAKTLFAEPRSMFELYDSESDPHEMNNLSGKPEYAETEHRLKAKLHEWMIVN
ncbi:sulfatase, partial [Persicitalea sp.]|uniref:sulfatase family protein n=1 Tax=Persicitalea sp. TaxID=3100273 RepID=UPI0035941188